MVAEVIDIFSKTNSIKKENILLESDRDTDYTKVKLEFIIPKDFDAIIQLVPKGFASSNELMENEDQTYGEVGFKDREKINNLSGILPANEIFPSVTAGIEIPYQYNKQNFTSQEGGLVKMKRELILPVNIIVMLMTSIALIAFATLNLIIYSEIGVVFIHPVIHLALLIIGLGWGGTSIVSLIQIQRSVKLREWETICSRQ